MQTELPILEQNPKRNPKPPWLRIKFPTDPQFGATSNVVEGHRLHTICEEAKCPNQSECWSHGTATFLLLGDICTRGCTFCSVTTGRPLDVDEDEPARIAQAAVNLGLNHVVLTSVNRDDLPDGGSTQFVRTCAAIRERIPESQIEILIPDFKGDWNALEIVMKADIKVLNHNLETVPRLYKKVRPGAIYERSLELIERAGKLRPDVKTKSGIMIGVGEEKEEVIRVIKDIRATGCQVLTIGQYLQPTPKNLPVTRYVHPDEFAEYKQFADGLGFEHVESAPLVRSSYHAWKHVQAGRL
jgi:lipoic acid synthetase